MIENKTVFALIPARGGSKGIPYKCIAKLNGKPLIAYSIEQALASRYIDRVVVSTDDDKIAAVSKQFKADVPFLRSFELAGDESSTVSVILDALSYFKNVESALPDIIMILQPTSPLRTTDDIDRSLEKYSNAKVDSLLSISKPEISPYWFKKIDDKGFISDFLKPPEGYYRRQDTDNIYVLNGAIYIYDSEKYLLNKINSNSSSLSYIMPVERSVDIDTPLDLEFAEFLLTRVQH